VYDQARLEGFTDLQAKLLAQRLPRLPTTSLRALVNPTVNDIPRASQLPDIDRAAKCIADTIEGGQVIALVTDHDCDGQSASVVLWRMLIEAFGVLVDRVHVVTSHRLKEGYGVSSKLVERILSLEPRPNLVITADQGSTDEPRIAELAKNAIRCVVTDHHHLPEEGPPASAVACVNPARSDSTFDSSIAGVMVAWYVMVAVREELKSRGLPCGSASHLYDCLSACAVGTVGDCVDLGMSHANRWATQEGLKRIRQGGQPIWEAFSPFVRNEWSASALAFQIAPRCNAISRLGDAKRGIDAMCSKDLRTAYEWVQLLDAANSERKEIQKSLTDRALAMACDMIAQGAPALCLPFYVGGHAGVHGITASRVVEAYGLPTVCLSPTEEDSNLMTGSIRSVEGAHVKHILDAIAAANPELGLRYGGHAMAGGVRLAKDKVPAFALAWEAAVADALEGKAAVPFWHDGELMLTPSRDVAREMAALEPFGRGFAEPAFMAIVDVTKVAYLGRDQKHVQLEVRWVNGRRERMVWFNSVASDGAFPIGIGRCRVVYELTESTYRSGPGYDLKVKAVLPQRGEG
jgi:single-stranded-DNA-specific exonuclease